MSGNRDNLTPGGGRLGGVGLPIDICIGFDSSLDSCFNHPFPDCRVGFLLLGLHRVPSQAGAENYGGGTCGVRMTCLLWNIYIRMCKITYIT